MSKSSGEGERRGPLKKYRVPALEKAIAILDLVASAEQAYTVTGIHKQLNISKSTVFAILNVLESHDFVRKDEKGSYTIGLRLYQLGMAYISNNDMIKIARPHLKALMHKTGFTVHLGILDEGEILYVDKVEPDSFIKFSTFPGMRSPIHISSLGKAIAAFLEEDQLNRIVAEKGLGKYTPHTLTDPRKFKQSLEEIRQNGYALEDEEGEIGVRCIGAPVFQDESGHASAAVSIVGHTSTLTPDKFAMLGRMVKSTAKDISKEMVMGGSARSRPFSNISRA